MNVFVIYSCLLCIRSWDCERVFGMDRAWEHERVRGMEMMYRSMERQRVENGGIHYIPAAQMQQQQLLQQQQLQLQLYQQQRIKEKVKGISS